MSDDWTEVDSFRDAAGRSISVGYWGGLVRIAVRAPAGEAVLARGVVLASVAFDADQRDRFMKAYAEAERQAEDIPKQAGATR